jgi:hypothetical protein
LAVIVAFLTACGKETTPALSPTPEPTLLAPTAVPATPTPVVEGNRFRIPGIGVDAPVVIKVVGRDGQMPEFDDPDQVVLFDFEFFPGYGGWPGIGNAIVGGKVDSGNAACKGGSLPPPCPGVFWDLRKLASGDEIQFFWEGQLFLYKVTSMYVVHMNDFAPPLRNTGAERITLFTGAPPFERERGQYVNRLIVEAEPVSGVR